MTALCAVCGEETTRRKYCPRCAELAQAEAQRDQVERSCKKSPRGVGELNGSVKVIKDPSGDFTGCAFDRESFYKTLEMWYRDDDGVKRYYWPDGMVVSLNHNGLKRRFRICGNKLV